MKKSVFTFACPCCGKSIEVDTRSGKARAVRPEEQKGGQNLDSLLDAHKHESDRLTDLFSSAQNPSPSHSSMQVASSEAAVRSSLSGKMQLKSLSAHA